MDTAPKIINGRAITAGSIRVADRIIRGLTMADPELATKWPEDFDGQSVAREAAVDNVASFLAEMYQDSLMAIGVALRGSLEMSISDDEMYAAERLCRACSAGFFPVEVWTEA